MVLLFSSSSLMIDIPRKKVKINEKKIFNTRVFELMATVKLEEEEILRRIQNTYEKWEEQPRIAYLWG